MREPALLENSRARSHRVLHEGPPIARARRKNAVRHVAVSIFVIRPNLGREKDLVEVSTPT